MPLSNIKAVEIPAWKLYLAISEMADKESILHNNHPVDSIEWHAQNARRDAYHNVKMLALKSIKLAC